MIWRMSKCVRWDKIISKYDTSFDFGINFDIFGFCRFWSFGLSQNTDLKNDMFKICFRESAKRKMTAQTGAQTGGQTSVLVLYFCNFGVAAAGSLFFSKDDVFAPKCSYCKENVANSLKQLMIPWKSIVLGKPCRRCVVLCICLVCIFWYTL